MLRRKSGTFLKVCHSIKRATLIRVALFIESNGGVEGDRTPDLMTASHALSQLSYDPEINYEL